MGHEVLFVDYFTGNKDNIGADMGIWASAFQADAARRDLPALYRRPAISRVRGPSAENLLGTVSLV